MKNRMFQIIVSLALLIMIATSYFIFSSYLNTSATLLSGEDEQASHLQFMSGGLGKSLKEIEKKHGSFNETGAYEGGTFYRYPDVTYFFANAKGPVVAVATHAKNLTKRDMDTIAELRRKSAILTYNNEAENTWIEIYEDNDYEVVIEYRDGRENIELVWLTEHHLFSR
ncbi:hypothetical protein MM221_01270 [Salipaludibacillus sp. LMS25]|uniref:hypothetical protein n=1 Tax=Salipaludibacillus sp. LMS25 TaxID=2924031 RepID=UPI0020CFED44|nr:hypothetical protein [Salipaludibacillus sp. LMS25]UTR15258.1 hypothetical protein MM221_01270 [Salipaludibacillus sp. LMS25]